MINVSTIREVAEHLVRINFVMNEDIERWMRMHEREVIRVILGDNEYIDPEVHEHFFSMYVATSMLDFSNASVKLNFAIERAKAHFVSAVSAVIDEILEREDQEAA